MAPTAAALPPSMAQAAAQLPEEELFAQLLTVGRERRTTSPPSPSTTGTDPRGTGARPGARARARAGCGTIGTASGALLFTRDASQVQACTWWPGTARRTSPYRP